MADIERRSGHMFILTTMAKEEALTKADARNGGCRLVKFETTYACVCVCEYHICVHERVCHIGEQCTGIEPRRYFPADKGFRGEKKIHLSTSRGQPKLTTWGSSLAVFQSSSGQSSRPDSLQSTQQAASPCIQQKAAAVRFERRTSINRANRRENA